MTRGRRAVFEETFQEVEEIEVLCGSIDMSVVVKVCLLTPAEASLQEMEGESR